MDYLVLSVFWPAITYIIYSFIASFIQDRRTGLEATRLGYKPAPNLKNRWPFGLERIMRMKAADRAPQFPAYLGAWLAKIGYKILMSNRPSHWIRGIGQGTPGWLSGTAEGHDRIIDLTRKCIRGVTKNRAYLVRRIWLIVAKLIKSSE